MTLMPDIVVQIQEEKNNYGNSQKQWQHAVSQ